MQKIFLLCTLVFFATITNADAQTLFTYGKHAVSKQEFLAAFQKNNNTAPSAKAYADYLNMYIRYKLKVQAAYDMRLDTLPTQKTDLADFRNQVMGSFMTDEKTLDALVKEAMVHSEKEIRLSHIYIPFTGNDSSNAKTKASRALQELSDGKSFETVAQLYSSDTTVRANKGDIGYITAFVLPYPLEKLAYATPLNSNSPIYKSRNAYHIFRRTAERPATVMLQIAQILLPLPATATADESAVVSKLADSIYTALQNGANFGNLAQKYSGDNASFNNQGVMPPFYPGTYDNSFEAPAFALQKDEDISKPVRTNLGIHLLKRITVYKNATDTGNAGTITAMRTRVLGDARHTIAIDAVAEKAAKLVGVKKSAVPADAINLYTKSFFDGRKAGTNALTEKTLLATVGGKTLTLSDYGKYLSANGAKISNTQPALTEQQIYGGFIKSEVLAVYQQNLEKYQPLFARQLQEFSDGNLIFEAMQANIWDKAVNDEAGLKKYYEQHRDLYTWKESVEGVIFTCVDSSAAQNFYTELKSNPPAWKSISEKSKGIVQADSGRFEIDQLPAYGNSPLQAGTVTAPAFRTDDLTTNFIYVLHNMPANLPRNFDDAKGFVLNDYQTVLEDDWINSLKKKYPVKVNATVLKSLNR
jgi:peptidyl-prolyl cis-trans isomerase SurA